MQSDEDTLFTISKEIFDSYEFDSQFHVVKQYQVSRYHYIRILIDNAFAITNRDNVPTIITDIIDNT